MRIIYVAMHDSGDNDDEGAITDGLVKLGHDVVRVPEEHGHLAVDLEGDFLLCHKWSDFNAMRRVRIPIAFWFFDVVRLNDPKLERRSVLREAWIRAITRLSAIGFTTDGDWVAQDDTGKLRHLLQGADQRYTDIVSDATHPTDLLFAGTSYGTHRADFIDALANRYGNRFVTLRGAHNRELADYLQGANICIAPDAPASDLYWSNRVYLTLGYRGFLMHPRCAKLETHYEDGKEIVFYDSREHLYSLIGEYESDAPRRRAIAEAGHTRTVAEHTYAHRCRDLVNAVREVL